MCITFKIGCIFSFWAGGKDFMESCSETAQVAHGQDFMVQFFSLERLNVNTVNWHHFSYCGHFKNQNLQQHTATIPHLHCEECSTGWTICNNNYYFLFIKWNTCVVSTFPTGDSEVVSALPLGHPKAVKPQEQQWFSGAIAHCHSWHWDL